MTNVTWIIWVNTGQGFFQPVKNYLCVYSGVVYRTLLGASIGNTIQVKSESVSHSVMSDSLQPHEL